MFVVNLLLVTIGNGMYSYVTKRNSKCAIDEKQLYFLKFQKSTTVHVNIVQVPEFSAQISQFTDTVLKLLRQFKVTSTVVVETYNSSAPADKHTSELQQTSAVVKDNASIKATSYPYRRCSLKHFSLNTDEVHIIITWNKTFLVNHLRRCSPLT